MLFSPRMRFPLTSVATQVERWKFVDGKIRPAESQGLARHCARFPRNRPSRAKRGDEKIPKLWPGQLPWARLNPD